MAKFKTNLNDSEFENKKVGDRMNPLKGSVQENKEVFDAFPKAVLEKLRGVVEELETMFAEKDLSTEDFTTDLKNKLEGLENYDDGELKDLIESSVAELEEKHDEDVRGLENSISQKIAELVGEAPETLDTLQKIAEAFTENQKTVSGILKTIEQKASQTQVGTIEAAVLLLNTKKVDKVEGKGLSTNDFTNQEKEKLARLENYELPNDVVQDENYVHTDNNYTNEEKEKVDANAKKIDYLEKYGESEVIVLTNDEVIIEGNRIVGTRNGKVLNYQGKIVAVPEGIVEISDNSGAFFETADYMIYCDKFVCSSKMQEIGESTVCANDIILSDTMRQVVLDSFATDYPYSGNIKLTNSSTEITGYTLEGDIIAPAHISQINLNFFKFDGNLYVYNPQATMNCVLNQSDEESANLTIYGYAGSTAEAFAKENGYTFVNMGSDYSAELGDIESAVDHILELDNSLLGGGAL